MGGTILLVTLIFMSLFYEEPEILIEMDYEEKTFSETICDTLKLIIDKRMLLA